jgi:hypothetical protein
MHACLRQRVLNVKTVKRRPNNQNKSRKKKERQKKEKRISKSSQVPKEQTERKTDAACELYFFSSALTIAGTRLFIPRHFPSLLSLFPPFVTFASPH